MSDQPSVTAIITTYNQESYIAEAIDSMLSQDYHPLEIIVVNDGFWRRNRRNRGAIFIIMGKFPAHSQRNSGPSSAVNVGINIATGDILAILSGSTTSRFPDGSAVRWMLSAADARRLSQVFLSCR